MTEWLDVMLEEIRRKESEAGDAAEEQRRRESGDKPSQEPAPASK